MWYREFTACVYFYWNICTCTVDYDMCNVFPM